MSKASNQTLTLLAIAAGCVNITKTKTTDQELLRMLDQAYAVISTAVCFMPTSGNEQSNIKLIMQNVAAFESEMRTTNDDLTNAELICMASQCITDILEKLKNPVKKKLVLNADRVVQNISDYIDPTGVDFQTMAVATDMLNILYNKIQFTV